MIQMDQVSLAYQGETLLEGVSFSLQKRERCAFVGRNGTGKTTLFRLLTGKEEPDQGRILIPKGYRIGVLEQHIHFTCPDVLSEAAQNLQEHETYRAKALLSGLGFSEAMWSGPPSKLSGGFQLRLQLIKVLLAEPDCLLLDEPTNYLDILSIRFLAGFLQRFPGEMIVISHDRVFLDQISTHTMGINHKKVVKVSGKTLDYYQLIASQEELHEKNRAKIEKVRAHHQSYIDRFGAKASKAAQAQSRQKMISRLPQLQQLLGAQTLDFLFHAAPFPGKKMLEVHHLFFAYDMPVLHDLSFTIEKEERLAIIGKNGAGKSTLLRLLAQDLPLQKGSVKWREGVQMGYFGQTNIDRLEKSRTILQEIASANPELNQTEVRSLCGLMLFGGDSAEKKIGQLSGGEKSRVLLGKILAHPCNLLLLDEPTHHLDVESVEALIDAVEEFAGSLVLVTHSELILHRIAFDKLIICHEGGRQQLFLGSYADFLEKGGWEEEKPALVLTKPNERAKRAEQVATRAKSLRPTQEKIKAAEKDIGLIEADLAKIQDKLMTNPPEMQELLKEFAALEKKRETLYGELEQLLEKKRVIEQSQE
jgi:ATP-binding cassette subfamily F protein 3